MKISLNILSQRAVKICESRQTDACMSSCSKGRVINRHMYIMGCRFSIYSLFMDIHNSFMDIHNSFMDIHKSFMDIHNSFKDIHK